MLVAAVAVPAMLSGAALGAGPQASCVATITSYEGSQLQPGSVGKEVSGLATSASGVGRDIVSDLAKAHSGSVEACLAAEE
jgi:hypothetical protein